MTSGGMIGVKRSMITLGENMDDGSSSHGDGDTIDISSSSDDPTTSPADIARQGTGYYYHNHSSRAPHRMIVQIGNERIRLAGSSGWNTAAAVSAVSSDYIIETGGRGYDGTTAVAHSSGDKIQGMGSMFVGTQYTNVNIHGGNLPLNGFLDEPVVHNAPLSASEVKEMSSSLVNGVDTGGTDVKSPLSYGKPANVIGWWRMGDNNSGAGDDIPNMATGSDKIIATNAVRTYFSNATNSAFIWNYRSATGQVPPD
jgi:hypothetical protein